jgi:hypothetical protein
MLWMLHQRGMGTSHWHVKKEQDTVTVGHSHVPANKQGSSDAKVEVVWNQCCQHYLCFKCSYQA